MFNVYKNQQSRCVICYVLKRISSSMLHFSSIIFIPPLPEGGGGYTVLPLSVQDIFRHIFHIGTPYRGKRFWTHPPPPSGSGGINIIELKCNIELEIRFKT
jgi:hypothetical protein